MVLMELQLRKTLQVRIVKGSIKHVDIESDVLWQTLLSPAEFMPFLVRSDKVQNAAWLSIWVIRLDLSFVHLLICLKYDVFDQTSDCELLFDGILVIDECTRFLLHLVVLEHFVVPILFSLTCINFIFLIFLANEFLQKLGLPKFWKLLQLLKNLIKILVQSIQL